MTNMKVLEGLGWHGREMEKHKLRQTDREKSIVNRGRIGTPGLNRDIGF